MTDSACFQKIFGLPVSQCCTQYRTQITCNCAAELFEKYHVKSLKPRSMVVLIAVLYSAVFDGKATLQKLRAMSLAVST